jgi:hypothetical protein
MQEKRLTAAEVRKLPEGSEVVLHTTDKYGYPCTLTCTVFDKPKGGGKELLYWGYYGPDRMPIRLGKGQYFTVREETSQ